MICTRARALAPSGCQVKIGLCPLIFGPSVGFQNQSRRVFQLGETRESRLQYDKRPAFPQIAFISGASSGEKNSIPWS